MSLFQRVLRDAVLVRQRRELAGVFAGDLVVAHRAGCERVGQWTTVWIDEPYDVVVTSAGGYPLDQNFYQSVKGMVTALPALHEDSTLVIGSACDEIGSPEYTELMARYGRDHRAFLDRIAARRETAKDQWQFQLHARVLDRIGVERLFLANDGLEPETQGGLAVTALPGAKTAVERIQSWLDRVRVERPQARLAVIPEGPYTLLRRR